MTIITNSSPNERQSRVHVQRFEWHVSQTLWWWLYGFGRHVHRHMRTIVCVCGRVDNLHTIDRCDLRGVRGPDERGLYHVRNSIVMRGISRTNCSG